MHSAVTKWMNDHSDKPEFGLEESETLTFNSMILDLPCLDGRSIRELESAAANHSSALERERAIWELAYRGISNPLDMIAKAFRREEDRRVRYNLLWLARKLAGADARTIVETALTDQDCEVRDWARLHIGEMTRTRMESEFNTGVVVRGRQYDQTLPLEVSGFGVMSIDGADMRVTLSPLWFEQIQGRVMACPRRDTFMTNLCVEKAHANYWEDGSDHYEIYPFAGKSWWSNEYTAQHRLLASPMMRTYLSGKVGEDPTNYVAAPAALARAAMTERRDALVYAREPDEPVPQSILPSAMMEASIVSHVSGQYFGWAFASLKHFQENNDFLPGTVQLISPTNRDTQHLVNWYMCGTFRGKTTDHNQDGYLDINEIVCHGAPDGRLDYYGDGTMAEDPHLV